MVLSCFTLDQTQPSVRQCIANAHDLHRSIMTGFPETASLSPRKENNVLYRIWPKGRAIVLYVMSSIAPDWSHLSQGFRSVGQPKDISGIVNQFRVGQRYSFDLLSEPTKKQFHGGINSQRVLIKTTEERIDWLGRKACQNGFALTWVREDGQSIAFVHGRKGSEPSAHTGIRFRGVLEVTDDDSFRKAFCQGIGAGKSYGMGMLILFPAQEE